MDTDKKLHESYLLWKYNNILIYSTPSVITIYNNLLVHNTFILAVNFNIKRNILVDCNFILRYAYHT